MILIKILNKLCFKHCVLPIKDSSSVGIAYQNRGLIPHFVRDDNAVGITTLHPDDILLLHDVIPRSSG